MSTYISAGSAFRCIQSLLTFTFVSICLFILSILTYLTLRRHLLPISHLNIPLPLGLPPSSQYESDSIFLKGPTTNPLYLVSYINLSDTMYDKSPLDIFHHSYRIELICRAPRSYINRQLGSFFVQLILYSSSKKLIIEHSRLILFPYQSDIIRLIRTFIFAPLSIFNYHSEQWHLKEILIEHLINHDKTKSNIEIIQLHIFPSSFQLDQCSIHFHVLDLTGLVYSYIHYPILTGCLSVFVLFSIYMTFYLIITGLTMLNQMTKREYCIKQE